MNAAMPESFSMSDTGRMSVMMRRISLDIFYNPMLMIDPPARYFTLYILLMLRY
jgi:hypothetical protein